MPLGSMYKPVWIKKKKRYRRPKPYVSNRKIGKARPMRNLKLNYRSMNVYRFMRETLPSTATFSIIASGNYGAIGYMSFENLQFGQLPGSNDFTQLFARYKVDKIVTTLTPLYDVTTQANTSAQLEITRVNTKWMIGDFPILANADLQLAELAQIQGKSKSLYTGKRPLTLTTINPGVVGNSVVNSAGNEVDARRSAPWLALSGTHQAIDVPFKHNAMLFGARVDGLNIDTTYKYRVTHKLYFRCSQVG